MTANPSIPFPAGLNTTAFQSGSNYVVACLYLNTVQGMIEFVSGDYFAGCFYSSTHTQKCSNITNGIFKLLGSSTYLSVGSVAACIKLNTCQSGEDCPGEICGTYNTTPAASATNISIKPENNTIPSVPTGLTVTPGDGQLTVEWNNVPDPTGGEVFAYNVVITGDTNYSGFVNTSEHPFTLTGLTNGVTYTVKVWSVSHNIWQSDNYAQATGIPGTTPTTPPPGTTTPPPGTTTPPPTTPPPGSTTPPPTTPPPGSTTPSPVITTSPPSGGGSSGLLIVGSIVVIGALYFMSKKKKEK